MRKTYIAPQCETIYIEPQKMLAASLQKGGSIGDSGDIRSNRRDGWNCESWTEDDEE